VTGDAGQGRGAGVPGAVLFGLFDLLPLRPDGIDGFGFGVAKDVRVAADELLDDVPGDFFKIKRAAFARELAMEDDLQEQVAKFLQHFVIVSGLDGVNQFVNLLDGMEAQAHMILLPVPRTTRRRAQPGHDAQKVFDRGWFLQGSWRGVSRHNWAWVREASWRMGGGRTGDSKRRPAGCRTQRAGSPFHQEPGNGTTAWLTRSPGRPGAPLRCGTIAARGFPRSRICKCRGQIPSRSNRKCARCPRW